jgi:tRNA modification GTPase
VRGPALLVANKADLLVGGGGSSSSSSSSNGNGNRNSSSSNGKEEDAEEAVKAAAAAAAAIDLPLPAKEVFSAVVPTCAVTRHGLDALESAVLKLAGAPSLAQGGVAWAVNERQAEALVRAHEALMRVSEAVAAAVPYDCWTVDLRDAALALGEVSGDDVGEEVLDAVFSRFCLGK